MRNNKDNYLKFIEALDRGSAISILVELCRDDDLAKRISAMAKASLSNFDSEAIADKVFKRLNSIQVEDLWDNSGKTRYGGYIDPTELAFEMIENGLRPFILDMKQLKSLNMMNEEKECCKGILVGLLRYAKEGNNEFRDWAPDDPYTIADNIVYDWKNNHTSEDLEEIQAVYESMIFHSEK